MSLRRLSLLAATGSAALALCAISTPASADVIFDSQALAAPLCAGGANCVNETRGSGLNYAAVLQFSADVTVSQIGVWTSVDDAQDIKFLIFDSKLNGGTGDLLFSQTDAFAQNSTQQFIYTDPMSFTFQAGHTYDVGILGDGTHLTGGWIGGQNLTDGPVTEIARNANFSDFNNPATIGYAGVSPFVQLITPGGAAPEPASWALMIGGFGLAGAALRRRRTVAAAA